MLYCFSLTSFLSCLHKLFDPVKIWLFTNHFSRGICLSCNHFLHTVDTWHGAESCWNISVSLAWKRSCMEMISLDSSISIVYFWAFMFLNITKILPKPFDAMQPRTMTLTGCFTLGVMQPGCISLPILRPMYFRPSLRNREILISSLQITLPHCSVVQLTRILA